MAESTTVDEIGSDRTHLTTIAKGAGINFFGTLAGRVLLMLFALMVARVLGPESVGLYFLGWTVINISTIPALMGLDTGIVRYVSLLKGAGDDHRVKGVMFSAFSIALPFSVLIMVGVYALAGTFANVAFGKPEFANVLRIFAFSIPFLVASRLCLSALQALKHMRYRTYVKDLSDGALKVALAGVALVLGWQLLGVVLATILASAFVAGLAFAYVKKASGIFDRSLSYSFEFKDLLKFSIPQTFSNTLIIGIVYMDILMLGIFLPAKDIGIYSIAAKIAVLSSLFQESFGLIFAPVISDRYHQNDMESLSNLFKAVTTWTLRLSLPVSLFLILASTPILEIVGRDYAAGAIVLIILSASHIINNATGPVGPMIIMSGRPLLELMSNILVFLLNLVLNLVLIPRFGILGAATATGISVSSINVLKLCLVWLVLRIHPFKLDYIKPLISGLIASLVGFVGLRMLVSPAPFLSLVLLGIVFLPVYVLTVVLLGADQEDRWIIESIRNRLWNQAPQPDLAIDRD